MAIKLYNNSKIDSKVLLPIIKHAMKILNLKGTVLVLIKKGTKGGGTFYKGSMFKDKRLGHYRWIKADLGKVEINPMLRYQDPLECARSMYTTIMHEFKHVFDYKEGKISFSHKLPYRKRPCEISARWFAKYEVKHDEELILNLAIEIERIEKEKGRIDQ